MPREPLKFAIVCAQGLGDGLLSMILAHNLQLAGKEVTLFSSILCELRDWFPSVTILPYPTPDQFTTTFSQFDTVIAADHSLVKESHHFGNELIILKESGFNKRATMVENLRAVCEQRFHLPFSSRENGIVSPSELRFRAYPKRVLLHPMSSDVQKNWPAEKFITLSHSLEQEGFQPVFCVSPAEAKEWNTEVAADRLPHFPTVSALACFVYESGYLIGNDSGVGHLASALHIPTLSLFARKSYSHLWRPGWGVGQVVSPPDILLGSRLKHKYWKTLLSVRRVKNAFEKLVEQR